MTRIARLLCAMAMGAGALAPAHLHAQATATPAEPVLERRTMPAPVARADRTRGSYRTSGSAAGRRV